MRIIVVGAGACGLMAARELLRAGSEVTILEARDRIGGRIYPLPTEQFGYEAMGGAEFLHGEAQFTEKLVEEAGLTLTQSSEWWNVFDGEPTKRDVWGPVPDLLERLRSLERDMTVEEFLNQYFSGPEHTTVREFATRWTQSYDAADIERASALFMREEMLDEVEWPQRGLREGYGELMRHLAKDLHPYIRLSETVARIDVSGVDSIVTTQGGEYRADRVLVTVPVPLLSTIEYVPPIPHKIEAASRLGFGRVIKILLRFEHKWWTGIRENMFERLFFMFSRELIPTWWTQYPEDRPVLTGWVAGPQAHALRMKSEAELVSLSLESLSNIFTVDIERLRTLLVSHQAIVWEEDPYARGGYSFATPDTDAAIEEFAKPEQGRLYFAGEALCSDTQATVEAALQSGHDVAARIVGASSTHR